MELLARVTIPGNSPRKSNSRKIVTINDHSALIKSEEALAFVDVIKRYVPQEALLRRDAPVLVVATMYYRSRQSDLSLELVQDGLQTEYAKIKGKRIKVDGQYLVAWPGIYTDDRHIWVMLPRKQIDKHNPRVELSVYALSCEEPWNHLDHDAWSDLLVSTLEAAL